VRKRKNTRLAYLHRAASTLLVCSLLAIELAGCTAIARPPTTGAFAPAPELQARIDPRPAAYGPAWLGGDVAASIRVGEQKWLWLFGDTLFGSVRDSCPDGQSYCGVKVAGEMVNNTIGLQEHSPAGPGLVRRFWPKTSDGAPAAVFTPATPGHYFWPLAGTTVDGALVVLANENSPTSGLLPVANVLLRVENPLAPTSQWRVSQHALPGFRAETASQSGVSWTTALLREDSSLILVGSLGNGTESAAVLARLPVAALTEVAPELPVEWWQEGADGVPAWSRHYDAAALVEIAGLPGTSEATFVRTSTGWETWQIPALRYAIHHYKAATLAGPWHDEGVVYEIPAPWSTPLRHSCAGRGRLRGARTFRPPSLRRPATSALLCRVGKYLAYAPKAHPELAPEGGQVLSYNVNVFFGTLADAVHAAETQPGFYVPRMLRAAAPIRPSPEAR
jgi:hypothetical protein